MMKLSIPVRRLLNQSGLLGPQVAERHHDVILQSTWE
jgi:hypothetical protein